MSQAAAAAAAGAPHAKKHRTIWSSEKRADCVRLHSGGADATIGAVLDMPRTSVLRILQIWQQEGRTECVRHGPSD